LGPNHQKYSPKGQSPIGLIQLDLLSPRELDNSKLHYGHKHTKHMNKITQNILTIGILALAINLCAFNSFAREEKIYSANGFKCTKEKGQLKGKITCVGSPCLDTMIYTISPDESPFSVKCHNENLGYDASYDPTTGCLCLNLIYELSTSPGYSCKYRDEKTVWYFSSSKDVPKFCETGKIDIPIAPNNKAFAKEIINKVEGAFASTFEDYISDKRGYEKAISNHYKKVNKDYVERMRELKHDDPELWNKMWTDSQKKQWEKWFSGAKY